MEAGALTGSKDTPGTANTRTIETGKSTGYVESPGTANTRVVETDNVTGNHLSETKKTGYPGQGIILDTNQVGYEVHCRRGIDRDLSPCLWSNFRTHELNPCPLVSEEPTVLLMDIDRMDIVPLKTNFQLEATDEEYLWR